jgi:hypothetical protein
MTHLGDTFDGSTDCEHPLVNARDDLADAGFHAGLFTKISDVLASLSDDYACILGTDEGTKSERIVARRRWRTRLSRRNFLQKKKEMRSN